MVLCTIFFALAGFLFQIKKQVPVEQSAVEKAVGVPYVIDHLEISNKRPGQKRKIKYIVVHNTANPNSTAENEREYLNNPNNLESTSWHIVVDSSEMIEAVPVNEIAFHAGTAEGNQYGIGIEICESGDYERAEKNAIKLIAYLMKTYDIPLSHVVPHKYFSGKECPRLILPYWEHFTERVQTAYEKQ